jgi:hypothetical protein
MLCFLKRLAEFTYQHEPWTGVLATDSLSLLDTIRGVCRDDHGIAYEDIRSEGLPLETLSPEWDIVMNIRRLIAAMPNLQLQHVRGHQDRRVEYHQLNLMAQLNVDADAMANRFQREYGAVRPHATLTEGAGVHLVTPEGSITSNYASAIRYQATHKPLLQHIRERNGWTASIVDRINWTAHSASLRKRLKQRAHYIKLVHGILPTNSHLHRNNPSRRGCPVCNHRNEEWTHILRCPHSSRVTWRGTLLAEVRKACETRSTRPRLKDILVDGIQGWLESDDPECYQLESSINDDEFQRLIQQQNQIGWKQVFLGRFSW